ncbi:MAG TPA: HAMP domain-containing sensor histidine kinase, partial [Gemmataceae bacterium]|nr:HAMP domain-containing sensor histidine kinase [Gemmataceae bacterium]
LEQLARRISSGDLTARAPLLGSREQRSLARSFNEMTDRLVRILHSQKRFVADASHQLRTPLAAMLGQVEVALRHDRMAEAYRAALDRVHGQALELQQIVEMLLFLARADAESSPPAREPLGLTAWLEDYFARRAADARSTDVKIDAPKGERLVADSNAALLSQLLDTLLDNACKYSVPGTPIVLRLRREPAAIALDVEDSGCGILAEDLPHVFEPFYRSAAARRSGIGGVGLGLAVARRITLVLGGSLDVESTLGRGSRFTIRLPSLPDAQARPADPALLVPDRNRA